MHWQVVRMVATSMAINSTITSIINTTLLPFQDDIMAYQILSKPASHSSPWELFSLGTFYNCIVPMEFLPWDIRVAFPMESQLRQSRETQPTMHTGCFGVSIIH